MRHIPSTMATQHPDNACSPYWEQDGDGFVSVSEEPKEAMASWQELGVEEYMWDWEGKYADEAVIDKLFSQHYEFFKKNNLGKDIFLTFRLPNVWKEKGYSLIRALMVMLTSEDFAQDLGFKSRPLFEAILPMTERAEQLMYIQTSFQKLAKFKNKTFDHRSSDNSDYLEIIPLVEGVESQLAIGKLLGTYVDQHKKYFRTKPVYIRPFLARSDPALISGLLATVLTNKIALSEIENFTKDTGIATYPIIGAGSLVFRGGLNPEHPARFADEYAGVKTATIQSAFRYDYPMPRVKQAVEYFNETLPYSKTREVARKDKPELNRIISKSAQLYQSTVKKVLRDMQEVFDAVPRRRERRQHIGFLSYARNMGKASMPRAINFTAAFYSIGVPPECIGLGRVLKSLTPKQLELVKKYYIHIKEDAEQYGRFVNRHNIQALSKSNHAWDLVEKDILLMEKILGISMKPQMTEELLHENLTSQLLLRKTNQPEMTRLIIETGKIRKSLG